MHRRAFPSVTLSLFVGMLTLPACDPTPIDWTPDLPEESSHRFYDGSDYPGESGHRDIDERPIAAGSRMIVILADVDDTPYDSFTVQIADETVMSVEVDGSEMARLAATSDGITEVTMDVGGSTDDPSFELEVAEVASVRFLLDEDLTHGDSVAPADVTTAGYAMRPGAVVQVGAVPVDESGRDLSGQGLFSWTWDEEMFLVTEDLQTINSMEIEAVGAGTATLSAGLGEELELTLLAEDEATELRLYAPDTSDIQELDAIEGEAGDLLFGLAAFDIDGRFVLPAPSDDLDIVVLEGPEDLVLGWDFMVEFNGFALEACPGEGEVELHYASGSLIVEVSLQDGEDTPEACD